MTGDPILGSHSIRAAVPDPRARTVSRDTNGTYQIISSYLHVFTDALLRDRC